MSLLTVLVEPLVEIVLSLLLGGIAGWVLFRVEKYFYSRSKRLSISIGFVLLTGQQGNAQVFGNALAAPGSLAASVCAQVFSRRTGHDIHRAHQKNQGIGQHLQVQFTVFCNICDFSEELMGRVDSWTAPLFVLFFVLSGAELNLKVLSNPLVLLVGAVYIVSVLAYHPLTEMSSKDSGKFSLSAQMQGLFWRILGTGVGTALHFDFPSGDKRPFCQGRANQFIDQYGSCKATGCSESITKHLGVTLLPQAGVALGMALTAQKLADGEVVRNVVLFSVLVYELVGPALTKRSLIAAGEIRTAVQSNCPRGPSAPQRSRRCCRIPYQSSCTPAAG